MTCCERSGIRVVGQLCFQILFDFATLRSQTVLKTMCLHFRLFCRVRLSHGDRFMKRLFDVVLYYQFRYVER